MTVHTCEIRHGSGKCVLRVVAVREHRRALLADFAVRAFLKVDDKPPVVAANGVILDFPRALGVEGLFSHVLMGFAANGQTARDENGVEIPMPETTPAQWRSKGSEYLALARECFRLGGVGGPELVEPAPEPGLFDVPRKL